MALTPNRAYRCDLTHANWMHEQISIDFQQDFEKTDWFIISLKNSGVKGLIFYNTTQPFNPIIKF